MDTALKRFTWLRASVRVRYFDEDPLDALDSPHVLAMSLTPTSHQPSPEMGRKGRSYDAPCAQGRSHRING